MSLKLKEPKLLKTVKTIVPVLTLYRADFLDAAIPIDKGHTPQPDYKKTSGELFCLELTFPCT